MVGWEKQNNKYNFNLKSVTVVHLKSVTVHNFFGTGDQVCERQLLHGPGNEGRVVVESG